MEATGFGLAIIAEARTLVNSMKARIADIYNGPDTFRSLSDELDRLMRHFAEVETHLQSAPAAIPITIRTVFNETLASVRDTLGRSNSTLETVCAKSFPGRTSGVMAKAKSLLRRTVRATALSDTMNALQPQVQGASSQLLILTSMLVTGLKSQEQQDAIVPKLDSFLVAGNVAEVYRLGASTPALSQGAHLNFDAKNASGMHIAPEGMLKASVLSTESASTVTAAAGVITPAHGVVGMAGVGKTIALQGLAFDNDIRSRFPDGIHYITLGQGASSSTAIGEVAKIMRLSGASSSISAVERSPSLREAVDYAIAWFNGKICLFLVDDLWPTKDCPTGFLIDFRQLLRCSSKSRMALTTRSTFIAHSAGRKVDFGSRDPLGAVSVNIFMMHVTRNATRKAPQDPNGNLRRSVATILSICAGLPLALAIAGCAVSFLAEEFGDVESACDAYASQLGKQRIKLGEEQGQGGASLNAGICLSLRILEPEFVKLKAAHGVVTDYMIADLYTSLCVVRNQAWVPVSVLSRMWNVDKDFALAAVRLLSGLSLCKLTFRQEAKGTAKESGLMIHDLQLDYCKRQAETRKICLVWHTRLLNGYLEQASGTMLAEQGDSFEHSLLKNSPRSWWSVPDDGYIHVDLARHLRASNLVMELAALLLDARWMHVRAEIGGMLALKSDFECLFTLGEDVLPHSAVQSFEFIWKAIELSWGRVSEGQQAFQFQLCGRLFNLRTDNAIVDSFLASVETHTLVPYLLPVSPFFPDPRSAQVMEIPVGCTCWAVDCSPCGRYIAAGAGEDVAVADASTGDILKRLKGHSENVACVSFASGSKKIVSGSWDSSLAVWDWEASESPVRVFEGHSDWISGVSVSSDSGKIFSCSRDRTLMIWDANTGEQIGKFPQQSSVACVAVSTDDQYVAIGLGSAALKILDICTGVTIFEDLDTHGDSLNSVAFSAKGRRLVTGSWDRTIRLWDTETWTTKGEPFQGHKDFVYCATFSRDGQQIASGSFDGTVRLWDVNSGTNIWTSSNLHTVVTRVAFTPDRERLISGSLDGIIRIWDTRLEGDANEQEGGHSAEIWAISISHDGLRLAFGSSDGTVRLWDSRTGNRTLRPSEGHISPLHSVSLSHDGRMVVSGAFDNTVRLWDVETLNQIGGPLKGHRDTVSCVSFSTDGLRIVSGSWDNTVRIWDAKSGEQIGDALEAHTRPVHAVSESGDGCHVVSRDIYGAVIIWNLDQRTIVWPAKQRLDSCQDETSSEHRRDGRCEMTEEEARKIIRSCGQETPDLWPNDFPPYTSEVYCRNNSVYSNVPVEGALIGTLPSGICDWKYNNTRKVFVAELESGATAMCFLMVRGP